MFLLSPNRSILLSKVSGNPGQIAYDADFVHTALEPLSSLDAKSVPGWDTVGRECMDTNYGSDDTDENDETT